MEYFSYINRIWRSIERHHKLKLNYFFFFNLLTAFLEILSIGLVLPLLHLLIGNDVSEQNIGLSNELLSSLKNIINLDSLLGVFLVILIVIFVIKNFFIGFFIWWQKDFIKKVHISIAQRLFTLYLNKEYPFHLKTNSSILFRNITSEVGSFTNSLANIMILFTEIVIFFLIFLLLSYVNPISTLIVLVVFGVPSLFFLLIINKYIKKWGEKTLNYNAKSLKFLNQGLTSVKEIILLSKQTEFVKLFIDQVKKMQILARTTSSIKMFPRLFFEILTILSISTIIFYMYKQDNVSQIIPTVGLFFAAAIRVLPSMYKIIFSFNTIGYSMKAVEIISKDLKEFDEKKNNFSKLDLTNLRSKNIENINIKGLSFCYDKKLPFILKDLELEISKGENVGIVGVSGVGKTTLLDVLLGLLKPQNGKITFNNKDIYENISEWQNLIGYVPQQVNLIDDTILKNICFNFKDESYDQKHLNDVLNKSKLKKFIENSEYGLLSKIGERGTRISGGQRQRIGIARALYRKTPILIFDEATNSLDDKTKESFIENIKEIKDNKIIINISHDLDTLKFCDKIYVLKDGKLTDKRKLNE